MIIELRDPRRARKSQRGSAVLVVLAFLSIMLLLTAVNIKTLNWLEREVKLVDKHQVQRLKSSRPGQPAASPVSQPPSK